MASIATLSSSNAADLGGTGGYKDPCCAPVWTGIYFGGTAGYDWAKTTAVDQLATNGLPWNKLGDTFNSAPNGGTVAGTFGYNWQRYNFVFGVEGDVGFLSLKGKAHSGLDAGTKVDTDGGVYVTARARGLCSRSHALLCNGRLFRR